MKELAAEIGGICGMPKDYLEITALLESRGWTDNLVQERFGLDDCFALGQGIYQILSSGEVWLTQQADAPTDEAEPWWREIRYLLRGMMFVMPMIVSVISILYLRYSLWSYMYFSVDIATAIALGTILSFLVTGGFSQAVARRGCFYVSQNEYGLARRMSLRISFAGLMAMLLVGLFVILANFFFELFPARLMLITLTYYFFLSLIWLSICVLYMLQEEILFTLTIIAGIGVVYVLRTFFSLEIIWAQLLALLLASIVSVGLASFRFKQKEKKTTDGGLPPPLPRSALVASSAIDFFIYGVMYFLFLNIDRVMAWSTHDTFMPYTIWFRGQYELGLDWALFALILPMGLVELYINRDVRWFMSRQSTTLVGEIDRYIREFKKRFRRERVITGILSALSLFGLYLAYLWVYDTGWLPPELKFNPVTVFVFVWGAVGYVMLSMALLNSLYLFCLSEPQPVNKALMFGLAADILVGFVLSRVIHYQYAVCGFTIGTLFFLVLSTRAVEQVLSQIDFVYYKTV